MAAPVSGYTRERCDIRRRCYRSDGVPGLFNLLATVLCAGDLLTGMLGKPMEANKARACGWFRRFTVRDLAQLSLGKQTKSAIRQTQRYLSVLESEKIKIIKSQEVKQKRKDRHGRNRYRSQAAIRKIDWKRMCQLTGTSELLKKYRRLLERRYGNVNAEDARKKEVIGKAPADEPTNVETREQTVTPPAMAGPVQGALELSPPYTMGTGQKKKLRPEFLAEMKKFLRC